LSNSSPSLFHAPPTPLKQNKTSENFEWTIEDLSSLNPVNLVPYETQFRQDVDPNLEAKCQAAISSFFNEQQIGEFRALCMFLMLIIQFLVVPSPRECSLRSQKIILQSELKIVNSTAVSVDAIMSSTAMAMSHQSEIPSFKRDIATQTALTFPPILPKEVENVLKKYNLLLNHEEEPSSALDCSVDNNDRSMMDVSTLRRKLFIKPPESPPRISGDDSFALDINLSPAPKTPELTRSSIRETIGSAPMMRSNDSFGSDMFGELSPIQCASPQLSPSNNDDVSMKNGNMAEK